MPRAHGTYVRLDEDALRRLNRFRRGNGQPLSRLLSAIIRDYLESVRTCAVRYPPQRMRSPHP